MEDIEDIQEDLEYSKNELDTSNYQQYDTRYTNKQAFYPKSNKDTRYTMKQADLFLEKNYDNRKFNKNLKDSNRENIIHTVFQNSKILDKTLNSVLDRQKKGQTFFVEEDDNKLKDVKLLTLNEEQAYLNVTSLRDSHVVQQHDKQPFKKIMNIEKKCVDTINKIEIQLKSNGKLVNLKELQKKLGLKHYLQGEKGECGIDELLDNKIIHQIAGFRTEFEKKYFTNWYFKNMRILNDVNSKELKQQRTKVKESQIQNQSYISKYH